MECNRNWYYCKTLLFVEAGRHLYLLDLWETAQPFVQRWAVRAGPLAVLTQLLEQAPKLADNLHRLPELLRQNAYRCV